MPVNKIAVIGNGGGGKTTLSRRLAEIHRLPVTHVDGIQFMAGMQVRNIDETRSILNNIASGPKWVIDGFGPKDVMESRFTNADRIVFVDFPLWRHYWWCTKRQIKSIWHPRSELPEGCDEANFSGTVRLFKALWLVQSKYRPWFVELFARPDIQGKMAVIRNPTEWKHLYNQGF